MIFPVLVALGDERHVVLVFAALGFLASQPTDAYDSDASARFSQLAQCVGEPGAEPQGRSTPATPSVGGTRPESESRVIASEYHTVKRIDVV